MTRQRSARVRPIRRPRAGAALLAVLPLGAWLLASGGLAADDGPVPRRYPAAVQSILEERCTVCHGCYDAPCQLKLDDWIGLERGASKDRVYDGTRLLAAQLTRLYEDALTTEQWREKGFYPVVGSAEGGTGVLQKMLDLKAQHPLPRGRLPDSFDFSLGRDQMCPQPDEFARYAEERPLQGMPFGFPGLDEERLATLTDWLQAGAPGVDLPPLPEAEAQAVTRWEAFLNADDAKSRLMSRYIYEHLFIGDLHFDELDAPSRWYRLVRSRSAPGQPIDIIATRRPYDDPGTETFYYRLQERPTTRLAKRHMPYALNGRRMERWRSLFLEPAYEVTKLPDYSNKISANPFITFEQLPVNARYRFMLDEAHFTIMAYIKGPVCRGQVALNVIDDHFWVAFTRPGFVEQDRRAAFLAREAKHMRLPAPKGSLVVTLLEWRRYAKSQKAYLRAESRALATLIDEGSLQLDMDLIWDGGPEKNANAALTIFRHFDSATVVRGLVGQRPKTMWVIDYSLLERIHYLLVAGFDVYGSVGHQLESRLYMDFLRMEGEQNFLRLLPSDEREAVRDHWYRGARDHVKDFLLPPENAAFERETAVRYATGYPKEELMQRFRRHIPAASNDRWDVADSPLPRLMQTSGAAFSHLPEVSFVQVLSSRGEQQVFSLLHHRAHSNIAQLFQEQDRLLPDEDTVTVVSGIIGAYPNMYFQVVERELDGFVDAILALDSAADYTALVERFGVRRSAPWFWRVNDRFTEEYRSRFPVEAGLFDLNRYENR